MRRLIGHVQSNLRLLEKGKYCIDIIEQNLAVISALHNVNEIMLNNHLRTCVKDAMQNKNRQRQSKVINEIIRVYNKAKNT